MEIEIETTFKATVALEVYKDCDAYKEGLKSKPCETGEWYGDVVCEEINISEEISKHLLDDKAYKITIQIVEVE